MGRIKYLKSLSLLLLVAISALAYLASTAFSYYAMKRELEITSFTGQIRTNQYFDSGDGSENNPYIITRPIHLYNLSRLNALGLLNSKKYYEVGKDDGNGNIRVYGTNDGNTLNQTVLDMTGQDIAPIGSEITPFFGEFEGNDLSVSNLTVNGGGKEDIGVFGYVASSSSIKNVSFTDLTIDSEGYSNTNTLFSDASMTSMRNNVYLTYGGNRLENINNTVVSSSNALNITLNSGSLDSNYTYSIVPGHEGVLTNDKKFNTSIINNTNVDNGKSFILPIYIVASYFDENYNYVSSVMQTYDITFKGTASGVNIEKAEIRSQETHGFNIGYIAGHCDGTMEDCYVNTNSSSNDSIFTANKTTSGYTSTNTNSKYGLVGLISPNHSVNELIDGTDSGSVVSIQSFRDGSATTPSESQTDFNISATSKADFISGNGTGGYITATSDLGEANASITTKLANENDNSSLIDYYTENNYDYYKIKDNKSGNIFYPQSIYRKQSSSNAYFYRFNNIGNRSSFSSGSSNVLGRAVTLTSDGAGRVYVLYTTNSNSNSLPMCMVSKPNGVADKDVNYKKFNTETITTSTDFDAYQESNGITLGRNESGKTVIATNRTSIYFCYFDIPEAGSYYFGNAGEGRADVQYFRFYYSKEGGNAGGETSDSSLANNNTVINVDFRGYVNSTPYLSGAAVNFRESNSSCLQLQVYFDPTNRRFIFILISLSNTSETVKIYKNKLNKVGVNYTSSDNLYINSTNNSPITISQGKSITTVINSSSTTVVSPS